ncbi:hypothetical protein [Endozoicomonas sp. SCSIO W0465]|uniref:hypothetical protein n=1 Tax=Endozoicomonas sp. SCSIO W0465 TaxID=2918516 RepID=UPI0020756CFA|nr:hypothetical protein [Endozoicomonas sp. SCSIO W0465]USE33728.1 hypothetical protein MJO57_16165 [Endozoicomonas sp. SCSIO W0465]USE35590.1 hypothetical protein MJO57_26450 [Endozoicomonas sp. SCSIO W0465]
MDTLNLDFVSANPCLQAFAEEYAAPTGTSCSQPSIAGYSAQTLNSLHCGYLNQEVMNQGTSYPPRTLSDFSVSHLPTTTDELIMPDFYSLEGSDEILSCDFSNGPVDNDLTFSHSTLTTPQQTAQKLPPVNSLVGFSQPSSRPVDRPVAIITPFNNDVPSQVTAAETAAPESSGSDEPLPLTLAITPEQSRRRKAYQKAYQKVYAHSKKRKAYQKAYAQTEKRKAYLKTYHRNYTKSEKWRAYLQSDKGKAARQVWPQSEKGRAYHRAYSDTFKNTGDREQAKIAGKQAIAHIRASNHAKNNLITTDPTS